MCAGAYGDLKTALGCLEAISSHLMWIMGIELVSSRKEASTLQQVHRFSSLPFSPIIPMYQFKIVWECMAYVNKYINSFNSMFF